MERIRKQTKRLLLSALISAVICRTCPDTFWQNAAALSWWGNLYPKFCFGELGKIKEETVSFTRPKISFYLAKVFDW